MERYSMSLQTPKLIEGVSRKSGYRETSEALWYLSKSDRFVRGEEVVDNTPIPLTGNDLVEVFNNRRYVEVNSDPNASMDKKVWSGWEKGDYAEAYKNYLQEKARAKQQERSANFAEIITAGQLSAIKSVPKLVVNINAERHDHDLLQTIHVETIDDFNGIRILDIADIGDDILQEQGEFTIPRDIPGIEMTETSLNIKRWAFRTAFSYEIGMIRVDVQNLDGLLLRLLANKIDLKRNKDVADAINAVGNSGSQANWTTLSATDHFVNRAVDDITESLELIRTQKLGVRAQTIAMHPNVYLALYNNISLLSPPGIQLYPPRQYNEVYSETSRIAAFPNQRILQDDLLTPNRYFVYHPDAIWQLYGGLRTVAFENRETGYYGTNVRTYFNTVTVKSNLINGGTGILS
jgi:hypothetical protein